MAVTNIRQLLLGASLLFVATLCTAQDPPRTCWDTGLTCINDCTSETSGVHQWCGDCNYYVSCNGNIMYIQPCPADTYYSDDVQACVDDSNTCDECIVYAGSTSPSPATPPVGALCESTGPDCITHCDQSNNGIYQWCGRCDYFLQCSGSTTYYQECQPGLEYDHTVQACVYNSTTCTQSPCYEDMTTTPAQNLCTSRPCLFGGTCIQDPTGFHCICAPGYTGELCDITIDYCTDNTCLNGGTCLPVVGGFVCNCPPAWTGSRCQYPVNNCASFPCMNGATCYSNSNGFVCVCPPEWTGERCDTLLDPCGSLPCVNGGTCVNNCGKPQCLCSPGWTGASCDTYVDNCHSDPCQNGGTCQNGWNQWTCICPPSFTGLYCQSVVDLCSSRPCLNGATCIFDCGIYQCLCPGGYTGYNCETDITACNPNQCLNGGTCVDLGGNSFSCDCPIEWTGTLCESPNYIHNLTCGDSLDWSGYPADNDFTRLCYWYAAPQDTDRRATECRHTIQGIPLYGDYTKLLAAGGNFGCIVSQDYPNDLPATSLLSCSDYYQQDVTLGPYNSSTHLMVCLRYPYEGIPRTKLSP